MLVFYFFNCIWYYSILYRICIQQIYIFIYIWHMFYVCDFIMHNSLLYGQSSEMESTLMKSMLNLLLKWTSLNHVSVNLDAVGT